MKDKALAFTIHPNATSTDVIQLVHRIAIIVTGKDQVTATNRAKTRWEIGPANNHWLEYNKADRLFTLLFRYAPGNIQLWAYKRALIGFLGLEEWNKLDVAELKHLLAQ